MEQEHFVAGVTNEEMLVPFIEYEIKAKGLFYMVKAELCHENPAFCICENRRSAADQRLCFPYIDSTIPLIS